MGAGAMALVGAALDTRPMRAWTITLPTTPAARRFAPRMFLPDAPSEETLRRLAVAAIDAARAAGAEVADIRVGVQRMISVPPIPFNPGASLTVGYGVRARVGGVWGFQHGSVLTVDAVTAAAKSAVEGASRYTTVNARLGQSSVVALAPTPVVTGEWSTPMSIDPFSVPVDDYYRVIGTLRETTSTAFRNHGGGCLGLGWNAETRVFASTDGSLILQRRMTGGSGISGSATLPENQQDAVPVDLPGFELQSGGFELALRNDRVDYLLTGMDEAIRLRELPRRPFQDVGRFPIVFDGAAFGNIFGATASQAADAERAAGIEADASGTTFLVPPADVLAAPVPQFSPLLTASVDWALPSPAAVRWDDEGVAPEPYTLVERGHVADYHTTRETAPLLAEWYAKRGRPLRAHGCAVAPTPASLPMSGGGHLRVAPATSRASVYDLARDIAHGFIVVGGDVRVEPGLTLSTLAPDHVIEIQRGVPVSRTFVTLQLSTKELLKNKIIALGDARSQRTSSVVTEKGIPWEAIRQPVTAPAALCKDVDVVSWMYRP